VQGTAGSDRFVVEWALEAPAPPVETSVPVIVGLDGEDLPESAIVGVAIPQDFSGLAGRDPALARRWRAATRRALTHYLGAGYRVAGFRRDDPPHYVLEAGG